MGLGYVRLRRLGKFPLSFVRSIHILHEARCSASFLVRSVNNLRLLIRQVSSFVQ